MNKAVINKDGYLVAIVAIKTIITDVLDDEGNVIDTTETIVPLHYTLKEGENLIDITVSPPYVMPKWNGTEWVESATEQQIAERQEYLDSLIPPKIDVDSSSEALKILLGGELDE